MCKKLRTPHDSVACKTTLSINNSKCVEGFFFLCDVTSLSQHHGGLFFAHFSSQHCFSSLCLAGICLCITLLSVNQKWTGLTHCKALILFFFTHSTVEFLVFLGSLFCGMTQFSPSFTCQTDGPTFDSRISWVNHKLFCIPRTAGYPGPVAAKWAQIITSPLLCLIVDMSCLHQNGVFGFHQTLLVKYLHFALVCPKEIIS